MPSPYSLDLRVRVIKTYESGKYTLAEVADIFNIGSQTVHRWVKKKEKEGTLEAKSGYQKGHSHAIKDIEDFKDIVETNDFPTVESIKETIKVGSLSSIRRALKKIGYVKKKSKHPTKNKPPKKSNTICKQYLD